MLPRAVTRFVPVVVRPMCASTTLLISLKATARPTDSDRPTVPAAEPAIDAAPASALIRIASLACSAMSCAVMPSVSSMLASTSMRERFSTPTPAPLSASPTVPPPPMATEPASVRVWMLPRASASSVRLPAAVTVASAMRARTCEAWSRVCGSTSCHRSRSP